MSAMFWFDRRNGMWWEFDSNPKQSYYKFLRAVYSMTALEAWLRTKSIYNANS
jgi:hypothetical protein